jgi:hypothetical protein
MGDRALKYRRLLRILKRYNAFEDKQRGKGSERMLCRVVQGRLERFPIRCHSESEDKPKAVVKAVRRRLRLTETDGVSDDEFYAD